MFSVLVIAEGEERGSQLAALIQGEGYAVRSLLTRQVTPLLLRDLQVHLIVLEIALPNGAGLQVQELLESRHQARRAPVVVVSDNAEIECDLPDILDFLTFPPDRDRLLGAIKRVALNRSEPFFQPTADDLAPFKSYLLAHSGLHFSPRNIRLLERGLQRRMLALRINDYADYFRYLDEYFESRDELNKLIGMLTVGETSFFRYHAHKEVLLSQVLPELIQRRRAERRLRFWSAGCSTGEEPYSLNMLLLEKFPELIGWDIEILATDINKRSLRRAREGVYRPHSLRYLQEDYRQRYFRKVENHFLLKPAARQHVRFDYLNLQTESYPSPDNGTAGLDLILCRNVMIYFTLETMREIIARFFGCLRPDGYLFLGHAETLQNVSDQFQRFQSHGAYFYRPKMETPVESAPRPVKVPVLQLVKSVPEVKPKRVDIPALVEKGLQEFDREDFDQADQTFAEILSHQENHPIALIGRGMVCVNRGDSEEARRWCARAISHDDLCPDAYLLRGVILDLEGHLERAVVEFQKVLWLDSGFVVAHYMLAKIYRQLGKLDQARRSLRNTMVQLEKSTPDRVISWSGGVSRSVFLEICRRDLQELAAAG